MDLPGLSEQELKAGAQAHLAKPTGELAAPVEAKMSSSSMALKESEEEEARPKIDLPSRRTGQLPPVSIRAAGVEIKVKVEIRAWAPEVAKYLPQFRA